ncbi:MAG: hypothetical protein HY400_03930 [Elusimicrobia bacterium]|nr:hypothetical protein [Elusimicrobiota bacterium]
MGDLNIESGGNKKNGHKLQEMPEIHLAPIFPNKKERKGFLPWLFGNSSAAGSTFSGSGAMGGLLATKTGILVLGLGGVTVVGGAGYLANRFYQQEVEIVPSSIASQEPSRSSAKSEYVPAIQRAQSDASSLNMFHRANRGALPEQVESSEIQDQQPQTAESQPAEPQQQDPGQMANAMAEKMMGKQMGQLSGSLPGGGKSGAGFGDFGNKFGAGVVSPQNLNSKGVLTPFQKPNFTTRVKGTTLAKRAVSSQKLTSRGKNLSAKAYNQAMGVRSGQQPAVGAGTVDPMKFTADNAWEGQTAAGAGGAVTGAGVGTGGSGLVTSPSLDNPKSSGGGGTAGCQGQDCWKFSGLPPKPDEPWRWATRLGEAFVKAALLLTIIGAGLQKLVGIPFIGQALFAIGSTIKVIGAGLAMMLAPLGGILMGYGQTSLGMMYTVGGAFLAAQAIIPFLPGSMTMWTIATTVIMSLLQSRMGGP